MRVFIFEAVSVYKKARIVNGKYFNSISYGILKKDFENFNK